MATATGGQALRLALHLPWFRRARMATATDVQALPQASHRAYLYRAQTATVKYFPSYLAALQSLRVVAVQLVSVCRPDLLPV
jgi:hypothetical protein